LTEGRQALAARLAGIESGIECERMAPLLSALADGEADAAALAALRPHLRTCLSCRARLREFRAAPARVAALVPAAALATGGGGGSLRNLLESLVGAAQHKAAAIGDRVHAAAELATGQKIAAVAASAAALAGGGGAVDRLADHEHPHPRPVARPKAKPVEQPVANVGVAAPPGTTRTPPVANAPSSPQPQNTAPVEPAPTPDSVNEFAPGMAPAPPPVETPAPATPTTTHGAGAERAAIGSQSAEFTP
jgi:hypothetical protein